MSHTCHTCHASNCNTPVPPKMFMCRKHWYMLSKASRDAVWANYRPGQEIDMNPTADYLRVADDAIAEVHAKETRERK